MLGIFLITRKTNGYYDPSDILPEIAQENRKPASLPGERHAVLIAGSKDYKNYRHQSDIFQTYSILKQRNTKPENIITFAYNDVYQSFYNPQKGKMFNLLKNVDVYPGENVVDYKGANVTGAALIGALTGDCKNDGKRLKSASCWVVR